LITEDTSHIQVILLPLPSE